MIDYIKGEITYKTPTYIVVEAGGLGYRIQISLFTYTFIEKMEQVRLLTWLQIKEDSHTLFGFADENERSLFLQLISVQGIGSATAQIMLSAMNPDEIKAAIIGEHEAAFSKVKGIGPKTAKRIILDLKDKVTKDGGTSLNILVQDNKIRDEALSALLALGYGRIPAQKAMNQLLKEQPGLKNVEDLIKQALKQLS
jgi:Holliday junction DNA helicase RuvA